MEHCIYTDQPCLTKKENRKAARARRGLTAGHRIIHLTVETDSPREPGIICLVGKNNETAVTSYDSAPKRRQMILLGGSTRSVPVHSRARMDSLSTTLAWTGAQGLGEATLGWPVPTDGSPSCPCP